MASLEAQQYYAHPRNAFWPIAAGLFGVDVAAGYAERCERLRAAKVAVWDVLRSCRREGSLDSAIDRASEVPNDFASFFAEHRKIKRVVFNGQKSESAFRRHVVPILESRLIDRLTLTRAPSTSPAHAARTFDEKLHAWRAAMGF